MKHLFLAAAAFLLLPAIARAQRVEYERFVLENGMTVILHEDHRLPQAAVNLWYHVGSKDEPPGRSGFAHLFEHLMFMGTERAPGSAFDDLMEAGGGSNNATTSSDRTNYFESGPAELLPTLLWLEADRLEDLGRAMTQDKLDKQREVVRNERRQTSENQPYGRSMLRSSELLYPRGHPYHTTVIGSHEDLEAATVEDVQSFFATYYVPNNASLVVAGSFDPAEVRALVERLFGTLPRGEDVVHRTAAPVRLEGETVHTMTDAVQFARTSLMWHSPPLFAEGDAELDVLAAILADGISSRLYQRLVVQDGLAVDVEARQMSAMLGSVFSISALARPGRDLAELERAIDEVVAELGRVAPAGDEVERQKAKLEYSMLNGLQSIERKADRLNMYQFHFGEPDSFARDLARYREATPGSVRRWTADVLDPERRLVLRVLPEAPKPEGDPRAEIPAPAEPLTFRPQAPSAEFELANGVRVMHWERRELPLVELELLVPAGSADDPPGTGGLAALTADMLDEGAGDRGATEFADALDLLGARLTLSAGHEWSRLRLSTLRRSFDPALALAADAVLRPRFDEVEWKRVHDLFLARLRRQDDDPGVVARRVALRAFYGDEHPYGRPVDGTVESVERVTLDAARDFHARAWRADGAVLLVAGDVAADEVRALLERSFGELRKGAPRAHPLDASELPRPVARRRVVIVDRPGAVQTVVQFLMPAAPYAAPDRPARELLTLILGGTFTSRLNQNLREDKGYTYGARAGFSFGPAAAHLVASSNVRTDVTGASLAEFLKEFEALRSAGITPDELQKARATARQRTVSSFSTLSGILREAAEKAQHGRPFSELEADLASLEHLTSAALSRLASSLLPLEHSLLVLVGDRAAILPQLASLPLPPPEQLDVHGSPASRD